MDAKYWDDFAHEYDDTVIDAFTYGRTNIVKEIIERFASPKRDAADFGCGPGKILPFLSQKFCNVFAYDFSNRLLDIARQRCNGLTNIHIEQVDLSQPVDHLPTVDMIVSFNVVLMPDPELRFNFLKGMASRLKPGGHLILNVPSVESLLYSYFREAEWNRKDGVAHRKAEKLVDTSYITRPKMVAQGVFVRGTEPTKHYLREELIVLARDEMNLEIEEILKMEYDWKTEMEDDNTPNWMSDPYPWDWLLIAQKNL